MNAGSGFWCLVASIPLCAAIESVSVRTPIRTPTTDALSFHPQGVQPSDTVVRLAAAPRHPGAATLVSELTIGDGATGPQYEFDGVTDILEARDGSVWVLDVPSRGAPQLRQFSAAGKFIRSVGRQGQGPGEYRGPTGLGQLPDGRVVLRDIRGNRVLVYSASGEPVATWTLPGRYAWQVRGRDALVVDTAGTIYLPFSMPSPPGPRTDPNERELAALLRMRSDGTIIDTIPDPELTDVSLPQLMITRVIPGGMSSYVFGVPYSPRPYWGWSPLGYVVTGLTNRYAIDLRVPRPGAPLNRWRAGDPVVSIRRDTPPVPVSGEEARDQQAYLEAQARGYEGTRTGSLPAVPRAKPHLQSLSFGADGRIWAGVSMPSERYDPPAAESSGDPSRPVLRWREPRAFDVFEPSGEYISRVAVSYDTDLETMRGDTAWGVSRDADGVETVRRFRIAWRR